MTTELQDNPATEADPCRTDRPPGSFAALPFAQALGRNALRVLVGLQIARTVFRIGFAAMAAATVGRLVMGTPVDPALPLIALGSFIASAVAGACAERREAFAETRIACALRERAGNRLATLGARSLQAMPAGETIVALQRHPGAVAALAVGHKAAMTMMGFGPLLAAAALLLVSWQAGLLVMGLTPVMIVFFVLVGATIRRRADDQERAFAHLARQFADRIRTLPTIFANHAFARERDTLSRRLDAHAGRTMGVLSIAFVNAGLIDFFASLSIAMLAVFLGLGHLGLVSLPGFSGLAFWQSLFILMVAPEYFAPFRRFSELYHVKAQGVAAAAALDRLMDREPATEPHIEAIEGDLHALPERGLVAIVGASGSGKTTLLRRLAGADAQAGQGAPPLAGATWVSTDGFVPAGSLADAMAWRCPSATPARIEEVGHALGLADDRLLPGGLSAHVAAGGGNLSGGQRVRLAVARALIADRPVLADEPTAKLDDATAARVREALCTLAQTRCVVVATHDRALASAAMRTIDLDRTVKREAAA
ncbi:ATP-binding cassette domain-containing protein [Pararhizobium mangrovi]|uniref:ATP-binding cassette domain-containing protein n=1 Tax=Pararhizobium mangrovi TaxID=2590452 RepID=A0A506UDE7_9HYPH|nr:ATP-binding cassette domain-containing protein [Pararhizobium mangrovi]TPW31970.1 ATP-binding cassette domain-containing protein [Pararhizobium mangrovi]